LSISEVTATYLSMTMRLVGAKAHGATTRLQRHSRRAKDAVAL
ncbi:MAG: TetR/AcrR family transcriptional regulator, partial [Mesorhizobium sp.]